MDIDFLKSFPEDQIEMLLMLQMDKLPDDDFSAAYTSNVDDDGMPVIDSHHHSNPQRGGSSSNSSSTTGNNDIGALPQFLDSPGTAHQPPSTASISFGTPDSSHYHQEAGRWRNEAPPSGGAANNTAFPTQSSDNIKLNSMAVMREMIFRIAAMQPIQIDPEAVKPPKRRNVKISKDPQSVAARHRRERISERIRILQRLVPGGTKMDTASMLDEAIHYVKFLKNQVQSLERVAANSRPAPGIGFPVPMSSGTYLPAISPNKTYQAAAHHLHRHH